MKRILILVVTCSCLQALQAQVVDPKQTAQQGATDHVNNNISNGVNNGLDKTENSIKGLFKKKSKTKTDSSQQKPAAGSQKAATTAASAGQQAADGAVQTINSYQNYDFVPGDKILFEDNFIDDQDGEFPAHWQLKAGQAVVNKTAGYQALSLTDGNYVRVSPRMKTDSYLTDPFTIEYDTYFITDSYGCIVMLRSTDKESGADREASVLVNHSDVSFSEPDAEDFSKSLPAAAAADNYDNKWHHVAIAYKNHQLKVYVDQYRVLVVPEMKFTYSNIQFAGIGEDTKPIVIKNIRIASGGAMNMIGKKFTDAKIITHGINFDIDKATIKPESMGTLNMIIQVLKDNPDIKFEVDGHTDNSGAAAHNLTLSQQRADAVKTQLISMGVDASRLTSKGFGDTKPISDNTSPEGKANNRRVEFVKM
ncbi:MAG TPA: OmpA family protein [Chitinophagaceae bacterium]